MAYKLSDVIVQLNDYIKKFGDPYVTRFSLENRTAGVDVQMGIELIDIRTTVYDYEFYVGPNEHSAWDHPVIGLTTLVMSTRLKLTKTESEFNAIREELRGKGFEMNSIIRVPIRQPEKVP